MTMRLRADQIQEFSVERYRDFRDRLITHLRKHFHERLVASSDEQVRAYVDVCMEKSKVYGLTTEQAVACYAHLPLILGYDFESNPNCRFAPMTLYDTRLKQNDRAKLAVALAYNIKAKLG